MNKIRGLTPHDFNTNYKSIQQYSQDQQIPHGKLPKTEVSMYRQLIFDEGAKATEQKKGNFSTNGKSIITMSKFFYIQNSPQNGSLTYVYIKPQTIKTIKCLRKPL